MEQRPKPVVLCILDGWGHREETDHNAIAAAHTPTWDHLRATYPYGVLNASESAVGLPTGQMGNSEVGHMNIGAGRVVMQDLPRIDAAIADDSLAANPALQAFIEPLKAGGGACHVMGLLSDGGVHAHMDHMVTLAEQVANAGVPVHIHAFLDGRDTPPKSAGSYLARLQDAVVANPMITLSTLCGRYYAMDRDKRWERVQQAYDLLVNGRGEPAGDAVSAVQAHYAQAVTDEFMPPLALGDYCGMADGDGLLMANFRADRARQLLTALLEPAFEGFTRHRSVQFAATLGMVEYSDALNLLMPALFPPEPLAGILGERVAEAGLTQLRLAETEKYAHVTFFMNGGREAPFAEEARILVPSPKVATYDLMPEMAAETVTDELVTAIETRAYDLIIVNYANPDMVGHSGRMEAAIQAVEAVDHCLGRVVEALHAADAAMLITADHGNVEQMHDAATDQAHTAHTLNPVPAILVGQAFERADITLPGGQLSDIAPTLLDLLQLTQPEDMTGSSLLTRKTRHVAARA